MALIEPFYPTGAQDNPLLKTRSTTVGRFALFGWKFGARRGDAAQVLSLVAEINALLAERGQFLREGTVVDATILSLSPSTKNETKERDPEIHQNKKGYARPFDLKMYVGVNLDSGLVYTLVGTAANVAYAPLHGAERSALATRATKAWRSARSGRTLRWCAAAKRSKIKAMAEGKLKEAVQAFEKDKVQVRVYVEPFSPRQRTLPLPQNFNRSILPKSPAS